MYTNLKILCSIFLALLGNLFCQSLFFEISGPSKDLLDFASFSTEKLKNFSPKITILKDIDQSNGMHNVVVAYVLNFIKTEQENIEKSDVVKVKNNTTANMLGDEKFLTNLIDSLLAICQMHQNPKYKHITYRMVINDYTDVAKPLLDAITEISIEEHTKGMFVSMNMFVHKNIMIFFSHIRSLIIFNIGIYCINFIGNYAVIPGIRYCAMCSGWVGRQVIGGLKRFIDWLYPKPHDIAIYGM